MCRWAWTPCRKISLAVKGNSYVGYLFQIKRDGCFTRFASVIWGWRQTCQSNISPLTTKRSESEPDPSKLERTSLISSDFGKPWIDKEDRGSSSYYIIIGRIDRQEVRVNAVKIKELEIGLPKMFELNKQSQSAKEQPQVKFDTSDVIRRRKGKPDKRISRMSIKLWFRKLEQFTSYAMYGDNENDWFLFKWGVSYHSK